MYNVGSEPFSEISRRWKNKSIIQIYQISIKIFNGHVIILLYDIQDHIQTFVRYFSHFFLRAHNYVKILNFYL